VRGAKADLVVRENNEKEQMKLKNFCEKFDVPRTTALQWMHSEGFPAYNICGHWYIDIPKFYKWREKIHRKFYKYS
jgi:hypothetical protein